MKTILQECHQEEIAQFIQEVQLILAHQALAYMTDLNLMTEAQTAVLMLILQTDQTMTIVALLQGVMILVHAAALCQQEAMTHQALVVQAADQAAEDKFLIT